MAGKRIWRHKRQRGNDHGLRKAQFTGKSNEIRNWKEMSATIIIIIKVYKEKVIYVQNARQIQDNETMMDTFCAHHAWFPDQKETSFFLEERVPFPCTWQWCKILPNSICVLAMPTQLQAPPPHRYYEKLTLYLAETRITFYISSEGFIFTCPCYPSSSTVKSCSSVGQCNVVALIYCSKITQKTCLIYCQGSHNRSRDWKDLGISSLGG